MNSVSDKMDHVEENKLIDVLYVKGLPSNADKDILYELFSQVGPVEDIWLNGDDSAYVNYKSELGVLSALLLLSNVKLYRNRLKLATLYGLDDFKKIHSRYLDVMRNKLKVGPEDVGCCETLSEDDITYYQQGIISNEELNGKTNNARYGGGRQFSDPCTSYSHSNYRSFEDNYSCNNQYNQYSHMQPNYAQQSYRTEYNAYPHEYSNYNSANADQGGKWVGRRDLNHHFGGNESMRYSPYSRDARQHQHCNSGNSNNHRYSGPYY